ncbi:MAG TPA: heavy metal translocating P-type ATPase metal-binding domain-containing protein [Gemmatimonadaceae bacterium]|nr:heavy metal translocating P-type ATPase metal-binding domain-containing protein [Gemmatimonadaceae bacterium]
MTAADAAVRASLQHVTAVACTHCQLPVPAGLIEPDAQDQFCCGGCRTAFAVLHDHGLDTHHDTTVGRDGPVAAEPRGRGFDEFDHATFHELYVRRTPEGLAQVDLYLEGVHCGACVWLVERVPLVVPGVARAELNVRRSVARVAWDDTAVSLSHVARTLDSLGYHPHPFRGFEVEAMRRREDRAMLARIGVAGAIAANVMLAALALYSGQFGGMDGPYERFFRWVSLLLTTPALFGPGRVFFAGAWASLRARTLHMDLPIAIALAVGWGQGLTNTVTNSGPVYFDGLATLIFALLAGRYLQQRGQRAATDSAELLHSLSPLTARVVEGGATRELPAQALLPGMLLEVRAGETFAADGTVTSGRSSVDVALLTGESKPVSVDVDDRVYAGTTNVSSAVRVRVDATGEQSRLASLLRQVEESARRRAPVVQLANRLAVWFVAVVLLVAAGTALFWYPRNPAAAIDNAIALLVVTCPCALALATPLAVSVAIGRAARSGILIKGGDALERLAVPGTLLLDKTGTITESRVALAAWDGPEWVKPLVLALEQESSHPIAAGFRRAFDGIVGGDACLTTHVAGGGIEGIVDGRRVIVGSPAFVEARAAHGPGLLAPPRHLTPVLVAVDGTIVASAGFGDPVRVDARRAIDTLRKRGWTVGILSGDHPEVVASVGETLGLPRDRCVGGAAPEEKLRVVEQAGGNRTVVMVGDGVNDAAAMAAASVGVGVHGGAEACLSTADVYLARPGLEPLVTLTDGAARTMGVIRRNIAFSIGYNLIGATLAVTGVITPLIAAVLMPASSLTVVLASWLSRTFQTERAS